MIEEEFLTTRDIAKLLKLDVATIRRYIQEGKLRAFKLGREFRIRKKDFEEFLEERKTRDPP